MLVRREYWLHSKCPRCGCDNETNLHVIQCPSPSNREQMQRCLNDFQEWMDSRHIDPTLSMDIHNIAWAWLRGDDVTVIPVESKSIAEQIKLGWNHFIMGRICKSFTNELHEFYLRKSSKRNSQNVTAQMIHWIWTHLLRPTWNERNNHVHKHYGADKSKRQLEDNITEVEELYWRTDKDQLSYLDRPLLEIDVNDLKQRKQHKRDA